ncbi:MAG TPA: hypothetical protein VHB45_07705 [Alloacidobacterium sp.]|nr:hypothetical protein [Alloacidobacterium sp.]
MLSTAASFFVVICVVAVSIAFLYLLNRLWPPRHRRSFNSFFGWQFNFLGTACGVIISFMLLTAWTSFYDAEVNADAEAIALVNLSRLSDGLPPSQRDAVHALAGRYVDVVLNEEWPSMDAGHVSPAGRPVIEQTWKTLTSSGGLNESQRVVLDHAITQLSSMTEHRRVRELQVKQHLPGILWAVLILGSVLTISYACLFGAESFALHSLQVLGLALLISLCLTAIADLSRPFQGGAHVEPSGFLRAREVLQHGH